MIDIAIANEQLLLPVDEERLRRAILEVLRQEHGKPATISLAIVDDARIHELNRQYLNHDYPTDVLSFVLESDEQSLEGEVIVSAETAAREAARFGWSGADELLLYVLHGALHLVGYDDLEVQAARQMREAEARYLKHFGLEGGNRDACQPASCASKPAAERQGEGSR